jgi:hypothetical protein
MSLRQWFALLFFFILYLLLGGLVLMLFESPVENIRLEELNNLKKVIYGLFISPFSVKVDILSLCWLYLLTSFVIFNSQIN